MSCNSERYIYIYKGDDTDWNDEQLITVNVTSGSPLVDISTMTATFILGSYQKTAISLETGSFQIDLGAAVTGAFPYGAIMGVIKILDSQNRIRTVANQIPFYVTDEVIALQNQDLTIDVPQVSINLTVGGTVNYNNLSNKPSINGVTVEGTHTADYYSLATLAELNEKVSKSGDTMTGPLSFGDFSVSSDEGMAKIEGEQYGLRVDVTSGLGAALFTANGMGNVITSLDVKSTYSSSGLDPVNGTAVASAVSGEAVLRENADTDLQQQIDTLSAASDVTDIVGTYAELQSYDTQHLKDNDIIKVLSDSTHADASTYYRWSTHTQTFTYIGAEGPYYTKSEADAKFLSQTVAASTYLTQTSAASTYLTQSSATSTYVPLSQKAAANGVATLDSNTLIPSAQLPIIDGGNANA